MVNVYPHDAEAFTQGLIFRDGFLFESTGQCGRSTLRKVELKTGRVVQQHRLDPVYFGEGLAEWNGQLVQLTWRSQIAFVYDLVSFKPLRMFGYSGGGVGSHTRPRIHPQRWDGHSSLHRSKYLARNEARDGEGWQDSYQGSQRARAMRGEIYANIWHTDRIARIAPQTGQVVGWIDLSGLMSARTDSNPRLFSTALLTTH